MWLEETYPRTPLAWQAWLPWRSWEPLERHHSVSATYWYTTKKVTFYKVYKQLSSITRCQIQLFCASPQRPHHTALCMQGKKKWHLFPSEVIPSQGDESSALSIKKSCACVAGNRRNTRNNRSFPAPLNAPVCLYQVCARSFSFNQKRGKGDVREKQSTWQTRATGRTPESLKHLHLPYTVFTTLIHWMPKITQIWECSKKASVSILNCTYWCVSVLAFLLFPHINFYKAIFFKTFHHFPEWLLQFRSLLCSELLPVCNVCVCGL